MSRFHGRVAGDRGDSLEETTGAWRITRRPECTLWTSLPPGAAAVHASVHGKTAALEERSSPPCAWLAEPAAAGTTALSLCGGAGRPGSCPSARVQVALVFPLLMACGNLVLESSLTCWELEREESVNIQDASAPWCGPLTAPGKHLFQASESCLCYWGRWTVCVSSVF